MKIDIFTFFILLTCMFYFGWYLCDMVTYYKKPTIEYSWQWSREPLMFMHVQPTVEMMLPYLDTAASVLSESVWSPFQVERQLHVVQENLDSVRAILNWEKNGGNQNERTDRRSA